MWPSSVITNQHDEDSAAVFVWWKVYKVSTVIHIHFISIEVNKKFQHATIINSYWSDWVQTLTHTDFIVKCFHGSHCASLGEKGGKLGRSLDGISFYCDLHTFQNIFNINISVLLPWLLKKSLPCGYILKCWSFTLSHKRISLSSVFYATQTSNFFLTSYLFFHPGNKTDLCRNLSWAEHVVETSFVESLETQLHYRPTLPCVL